jgi:hypothetical protein
MSQQQCISKTNAATHPALFQTNNTHYESKFPYQVAKIPFYLTSGVELNNVRRELDNIFTGIHREILTVVP